MDAPKHPRNVHVLFVHGVGQHSRLSSLLRPYQSIRSNLRSPETPVAFEDLIPGWRLADFQDDATPPLLKLKSRYGDAIGGQPEGVYFYEVNYSSLAGVVRENHPLDLTRLFVGFDLAVAAARARPGELVVENWPLDHAALACEVQKLAGVFVAATVPMLGLPALLLKNYTGSLVGTFTRFFEDIATFAMDKDGEQLISAHVDRTVTSIVRSERFAAADDEHAEDVFVIGAHSLGTVVAHNYLVRHWERGGREVPSTLLTFGSPIGLIVWLWLFLDYPHMAFDPRKDPGRHYFCWSPQEPSQAALQRLHWINVVNHLDPIATGFPTVCVDLLRRPQDLADALASGGIDTRYIKTGDALSAGEAHTAYFDDRQGFLKILVRAAQLRPEEPSDKAGDRAPEVHWRTVLRDLVALRVKAALAGIGLVLAYFFVIAAAYGPQMLPLSVLYLWPPATIGFLTFFQRLLYGGPTKRTAPEDCRALPLYDLAALPYRLRAWAAKLGRPAKVDPNAPRAHWLRQFGKQLVSFVPTLAAMTAPAFLGYALADGAPSPWALVLEQAALALGLFALFVVYLMFFAVSEFAAVWRSALKGVLEGRPAQ